VARGALGHATAAYEAAAAYCRQRQQFGKPLASFQIVQDRLVKMLAEVRSMQLYCLPVVAEVNMNVNEDGDILRALEDIRQLLERIADATERLASCVGRNDYPGHFEDRLRISDVVH
jgi:alkylation response protein AidB-like acyl-CoA dehydrogenase